MKCIKNLKTEEVVKVQDARAWSLVNQKNSGWVYVPKSEWKEGKTQKEKGARWI